MRVFFGRLGIVPMPSIRKPLLFLGSCFFCCTTRGCWGCEKNVSYEPFWFNFLTNTYLFILRAYTRGREGRKEKQQGEREGGHWYSKRDIKNQMAQSFNYQTGKMGPKEVLTSSKLYSQIGRVRTRPQSVNSQYCSYFTWVDGLICSERTAPRINLLTSAVLRGVGYYITIDDKIA